MIMINRTYYSMIEMSINVGELTAQGITDATLRELLFRRYNNNWIFFIDDLEGEEEAAEITKRKALWLNKLVTTWMLTKDRYTKLVSLYKRTENQLLADLGTETEVTFNDTPQDAYAFREEVHATNYTHTKTTANTEDLILRINKIHELLRDIYAEWLDEFAYLFGDEVE